MIHIENENMIADCNKDNKEPYFISKLKTSNYELDNEPSKGEIGLLSNRLSFFLNHPLQIGEHQNIE
jgi:hypothetical protein